MIRSLSGLVLATSLVLAAFLSGCSYIGETATPSGQSTVTTSITVQTAPVQRGGISSDLSFSGNVQAQQQVSIIPKVSGRVTKMAVDLGSTVNHGDVLLEIETDTLAAQLGQAEAGLAAAQARLDELRAGPRDEQVSQAEANLKSAQARLDQRKAGPTPEQLQAAEAQVRLAKNQLFAVQTQADAYLNSMAVAYGTAIYTQDMKEAQSGAAYEQVMVAEANLAALKAPPTAEELAQLQSAVDAAQAQLDLVKQPTTQYDIQAAQAAVDQAQAAVDLARIQLKEATIMAPFAGIVSQRLVSAGAMVGPTSPVLVLVSTQNEVVINVDENSLKAIKVGQLGTLTSSTYPDQVFSATVTTIAPTVDAKSRTITIKLSPNDPDGKLRDGMFVQVSLPGCGTSTDALLVPKSAVTQDNSDTMVYLVANGVARRQVVTIGVSDGTNIEIVGGLTEGQLVATSNIASLRDGARVTEQ